MQVTKILNLMGKWGRKRRHDKYLQVHLNYHDTKKGGSGELENDALIVYCKMESILKTLHFLIKAKFS